MTKFNVNHFNATPSPNSLSLFVCLYVLMFCIRIGCSVHSLLIIVVLLCVDIVFFESIASASTAITSRILTFSAETCPKLSSLTTLLRHLLIRYASLACFGTTWAFLYDPVPLSGKLSSSLASYLRLIVSSSFRSKWSHICFIDRSHNRQEP